MIISPLYIELGVNKKRKYYINLNRIKTLHYMQYNNLKKKYKELIKSQIGMMKKFDKPIEIIITYFNGTKRKSDLDNVCVIQSKFIQDALVDFGRIPEDNYEYIRKITYVYGGYDKNNGRCEIGILEY